MRLKNIFSKFLTSIFFKKKIKSIKSIDTDYNKTKFREVAKTILGHTETKSINADYQSSIKLLYSYNQIDYSNQQTSEEKPNKEKEVLDLAEKENEKIFSNFFNKYSLKILENSDKEKLLDLACKSFVGNTGVIFI